MSDHAVITERNSNSANMRSSSSFRTETAPSLYQQALALHQQNRLDEAEFLYRQILDAEPDHHGALHFLGVCFVQKDDARQAIEKFEWAISLCDTNPVYYNNYAIALKELGIFEKARACLIRAVELDRNYVDAYANLGYLALQLKDSDEVVEHYLLKALSLNPNHHKAIRSLIELYQQNQSCFKEKQALERLITLIPPMGHHWFRLGVVSGECGDIEASKTYFKQASKMPDGQDVWRHKHLAYSPMVFENEEEIEEYWSQLNIDLGAAIAENRLYNWKALATEGFTHSFNLPHLDRCCKDVLEKFARLFTPSFPHERPTYKPGEKIKVGFLVTPGHEGGFLRLTTGLIEGLDPGKFEVCLIYNEATQSHYENRFKRADLIYVRYNWNFENAVRTIREAKCDVIYYWKAGADPWNFFLPMCRLAPIQCTSWGTHGTSGMSQIDYYVSWSEAEIHEAQKHYTESLYLLETMPHYEPKLTDIPGQASRKELGLPEEGAIYFCPHRLPKYHPKFDSYFKKILELDAHGHIIALLGKRSPLSTRVMNRIKSTLGPELSERFIFLPEQSSHQYYKFLSIADVILHSPVYCGEITAVDGFLYGIPGVTQSGDLLIQRYVTAYNKEFCNDKLTASNQEEYAQTAVRIGTNSEYREMISRRIHEKSGTFFENVQTVKEWERFFTDVTSSNPPIHRRKTCGISDDQAVPISNIDINVSYGCNLRCQYCTHFCSWISGGVPFEELLDMFQCWYRKISPERLIVVGGEPLLHPELEMIFLELHRYWPKARIDLFTNGLLLPKRSGVLSLLKELNGHVYISRHFQDEQYLLEFETAIQCLHESGVSFSVAPSDRDWLMYYALDSEGNAVPYDSDPQQAWRNCKTKNGCPSLMQNKLYKCAHMAWAALGARQGVLQSQWKIAEEYRALNADCSAREILALLSTEAVGQCRICPERYEYVSLDEKRGN